MTIVIFDSDNRYRNPATSVHPLSLQNSLQQEGEVCLVQPGFDPDTFLVVMSEDLRAAVARSVNETSRAAIVHKFLDSILFSSSKISYNREEMMHKNRFSDREIT